MQKNPNPPARSIEWIGDLNGFVRLIDQTQLPESLAYIEAQDVQTIWDAIKRLSVRGAPAIGIAAAMGVVLATRAPGVATADLQQRALAAADHLATSRPTAVNLFWALDRMRAVIRASGDLNPNEFRARLLAEAQNIRDEDAAMSRAIGEFGESLIPAGGGVLTHCNAGGLATAELGTALAPIYLAHAKGRTVRVYADETRPLLQGARLTAWELQHAGVEVTVLCDNMAGQLMRQGEIDVVITGADRIAANGDTANKIGTYGVAVLARAHDIPFYVAAPTSTFDLATATGDDIPIEFRADEEVRAGFGTVTVPEGVKCHCPAFDVTPSGLIRGIITDRGLISPVTADNIARMLGAGTA
jgi:methylthioribose-1-phosphate isomerase